MVTDRELTAMMADGLLNTVRDAAKGLYGDNQAYPCDDVKRMADEVDKLRRLRAELLDKLHGTPCAEIRWQQERETLMADNERLRAAVEWAARWSIYKPRKTDGTAPDAETALRSIAWHPVIREAAALTAQPAEGEK